MKKIVRFYSISLLLACALTLHAQDSQTQYTVSKLVNTAATSGNTQAARAELQQRLASATDDVSRAFYLQQYSMISTAEDIPVFVKYLDKAPLSYAALNAIQRTPGGEEKILDLIKDVPNGISYTALASAASQLQLEKAEHTLLKWGKDLKDSYELRQIQAALGNIGGKESLPYLLKNSKIDYARVLLRLAQKGEKASVLPGAYILVKENDSYLKCAGLQIIKAAEGSLGDDQVIPALKSDDRAFRVTALNGMKTDDTSLNNLAATYPSLSDEAKTDILNWIGDHKFSSQSSLIISECSKSGTVGAAALEAAGKMGGTTAIDALIAALGGENNATAFEGLAATKSPINQQVSAAMKKAEGDQLIALMQLSSQRHLTENAPIFFQQINGLDKEVSQAAVQSLSGVVSTNDASQVANLLDNASDINLTYYQQALAASVQKEEASKQYSIINELLQKAQHPERFYNPLAMTNSDASVTDLQRYAEKSTEALAALKKSNNYLAAPALFEVAKTGDGDALKCFVNLVNAKQDDIDLRYEQLAKALEIADTNELKSLVLTALGNTPTTKSFDLLSQYLTDKELGYKAATCIKNVATKCTQPIDNTKFKESLNVAIQRYQEHGDPDDSYDIDEIKSQLAKRGA